MTTTQIVADVSRQIEKSLGRDEDVLFAYLYGSCVHDASLPGGDIDIAAYLGPSKNDIYVQKEAELTSLLISTFRTDKIDLRILNTLPLVLQYQVLREGLIVFSRDEAERVEFETRVMIRFFALKPYLDEYRLMLSQRIRGGL
jgi:uncharacterized protein